MSEAKQWHSICKITDVADGGKIGKQFLNHSLLIIRIGMKVFCYEDRCPHAGAPLIDGKLISGRLTCRHHHWQFDMCSGKSIRPAGHQIKSYAVKVENDQVFISL